MDKQTTQFFILIYWIMNSSWSSYYNPISIKSMFVDFPKWSLVVEANNSF